MNDDFDEEDQEDTGKIPLIYTIAITLTFWAAVGGVFWAVYKRGGGQ